MTQGLKNLSRKIDAIYDMLCNSGSTGTAAQRGIPGGGREAGLERAIEKAVEVREAELERAIGKAVEDLERTKSSFKSKQIMEIKKELSRAIGR
ncbi:MAG: hypothetical protein WAX69_10155 [Victivallales bacterium]